MPKDGKNYRFVEKINSEVPDKKEGSIIIEFEIKHGRLRVHYLKVFAKKLRAFTQMAFVS